MFSLSKIALFSLISFATLAFAIPAPEARSASAKALLYNANDQIATAMLPVACATSTNATADYVAPLLTEVTQILDGLVSDLEGSDLSGCTTQEILTLLSNLLSVLFPSPPVFFPLKLTFFMTEYP
ncbi:hypothetical protein EI94DRAFT_715290 [Lactarius quietus]|nr:hypothetical protein EI94DRAFT_715290 [Lactarius quietus]